MKTTILVTMGMWALLTSGCVERSGRPRGLELEDDTAEKKKTTSTTTTTEDDEARASSSTGEEPAQAPSTPDTSQPTPATPTDTVWEGALAKTSAVTFGGPPYCDYRVTFTDLTVRLVVGADGVVKSGEARGRMFEEAIACEHAPTPASFSTFRFSGADSASALVVDDDVVTFTGVTSNSPRSNLAFEGARDTNGTIAATVRIHRTDIAAPLDWTVVANVRLAKSAN